jgi:hypothetical protein
MSSIPNSIAKNFQEETNVTRKTKPRCLIAFKDLNMLFAHEKLLTDLGFEVITA